MTIILSIEKNRDNIEYSVVIEVPILVSKPGYTLCIVPNSRKPYGQLSIPLIQVHLG